MPHYANYRNFNGTLGAFDLPGADLVPQVIQQAAAEPAERVARYAIAGAVFGGLLAATLGLAGGAVGPGNRTAVLGLLAIPIGGAIAGVLVVQGMYKQPR
jgi:hypothetical protein